MSREHIDRVTPLEHTVRSMIIEVAAHFGMGEQDIEPRSRDRTQVIIRAVAMWALRERYGFSSTMLARMFGTDHTNVMHHVGKVRAEVAKHDAGGRTMTGSVARKVLLGGRLAAE